jgi:integrase/recombinase XerD
MNDHALLGPWVRRFLLEYLVRERNLSVNTQRSYRDMLIQLLPYAASKLKKSVDRLTVEDLSADLVRDFLCNLEVVGGCIPATRNQRLGGLHALARFIGESSPEHVAWCAKIRLIPFKRTAHPCITYLDKLEMDAILDSPDRCTPQGKRDYALLLFLYNSGARASEAADLRVKDVDWHAKSVKIIGKGNKWRVCPLWPITVDQLHAMTFERDPQQRLFLNRNGQPVTRFGIHTLVERHAVSASAIAPSISSKRVSPHVIRHTTATTLLRSGVDINTVRAWLGHVSLTTTNIYAETDLETKARALATCAPPAQDASRVPWRKQPDLMAFLHGL